MDERLLQGLTQPSTGLEIDGGDGGDAPDGSTGGSRGTGTGGAPTGGRASTGGQNGSSGGSGGASETGGASGSSGGGGSPETGGAGGSPGSGGSPETGGAPASGGNVGLGGSGSGGSPNSGGSTNSGGTPGSGGSVSNGGSGGTLATGGAPASGGAGGVPTCGSPTGGGPDCGPTLVDNATFARDASGWSAESNATAEWEARDGEGNFASGSITVVSTSHTDLDGLGMAGAAQCVPVTALRTYAFFARTFVDPGQGQGSAGISIWFYDQASCAGRIVDYRNSSFSSDPSAWKSVAGKATAPVDALSMMVRLVATKPFRASSFKAHFDSIGVYER